MSEHDSISSRSTVDRRAVGSQSGSNRLLHVFGGAATVEATGRFLRRHLWACPVIAAIVLGVVGWLVNHFVENALRQRRIDELTTLLNADIAALNAWMADQRSTAELMAFDETLVASVQELLVVAGADATRGSERALIDAKAQSDLRNRLKPRLKKTGHHGYFVVAPSGLILAADIDVPVGTPVTGYRKTVFDKAVQGETTLSKPYRSPHPLDDGNGEPRINLPTMFVVAPLYGDKGQPFAALGLRIRPDDSFTKILQVARYGETGETYAFDKDGLLLSQSRFDDTLKRIGLLVDQPDNQSTLNIHIRDPQVDLTKGEQSAVRPADRPLTALAQAAVKGGKGANVDGYRDYRGSPSIGAWMWLDDADFAVVTEVDIAEAFRPAYILRRAIGSLMGLLLAAAVAIFAAMAFIARQQRDLQKATLTVKQLGQYALGDKIGSGGMGSVYKARHAMLRRPTAVKLLDADKMSAAAVARFEREVQLTSALTHPNTVAIYDYGHTPEGIFYYAMEYLDGMNLDELVRCFGPVPEARAVHLIRQACGALAEAHAQNLVHRDIKPANIFLTIRGGLRDFVKVLDFGLVKTLDGKEHGNLTAMNAITGTPLFISPEAVQKPDLVDVRSDVYAIGAVAYFLVTGDAPFNGSTVMEICWHHVRTAPEPPSQRTKRPLSGDLEALILRCLAKAREDRPADAGALLAALEACKLDGEWTARDAIAWWKTNAASTAGAGSVAATNISSETASVTPDVAAAKGQ